LILTGKGTDIFEVGLPLEEVLVLEIFELLLESVSFLFEFFYEGFVFLGGKGILVLLGKLKELLLERVLDGVSFGVGIACVLLGFCSGFFKGLRDNFGELDVFGVEVLVLE
jgi:hypothetical protein